MVDVMHESAVVSDMLTDEDTVMEITWHFDCPENSSDNGHSSDTDGETDESNNENGEGLNGNSTNEEHVDLFKIESVVDLEQIEFNNLTATEVQLYHFSTRQVAFEFYRKYAEKNGFAARKWNTVRNKKGDVTQQTYVCFKEGFRLKKHLKRKNRKREARPMTRCGCKAFFRVFIDVDTGRWHVKAFSDEHSHELLAEKFVGMLPAHRKMHDCDINQMNSMRDAGISVSQIYGLAANQCGGYDRLAFRKQDMYNEIVRQRRMKGNEWARELYEKRKMWATAHIRGNFFLGFCTTSRCEGMHSQVARQRELEADFESIVGEPILVSQFEDIERCGANIYTRKIFHMFRRSFPNHQWYVSLVLPVLDLKCSCLRMESLGIPCEHIICLLNYLEIRELPDSLIVRRWTKNAKHPFDGNGVVGAGRSDLSKQYVKELLNKLRESAQQTNMEQANHSDDDDVSVRDPARVRTKGCGNRNNAGCSGRGNRRTTCCSICQAPGHNKKKCPLRRVNDAGGTSTNHENV
ncbi:Zinc finger, PMZ-type [Sesbania bispinosa]|nr:Zinc finger, PMZ-type [Sesbania bispinosa]